MTQLLSISRAARLAGVSRSELQKRIRRGELDTFEGEIAASELLRLYPQVSLEHSGDFERVERIKSEALPKTQRDENRLPSPQLLIARLKSISDVLVDKAAALETAEAILADLEEYLATRARSADAGTSACIRDIQARLTAGRDKLAQEPDAAHRARLFAKDTFLRLLAAHVKLIPSGHDFFVEGTESILDASLRAGLKLAYGCSNANCGACKARVLSGEVHKIREHDFFLSEHETQMGYVLTCCHTAITDIVLEAEEALAVEDLPRQEIRACVGQLERLGPDMIQLQVRTPETQTLRFMAGQRVHLTLEDGTDAELPIASCPCNRQSLLFLVRRLPENPFSEAVFDRVREGHTIEIQGPNGRFVLDEESPDPSVFVAFADGIVSIKSMLEHAVSIDIIESFHVYWVMPDSGGRYQANWCRAMKESLDNFSYTPLADVEAADLVALIASDLPKPADCRYYLAGPGTEVDLLAKGLRDLGIERERLRVEALDA